MQFNGQNDFMDIWAFLIKVRPVQFGALSAAAEQLFTKSWSRPNIETNFEALSFSQPQSITQKGVHARLLTALEREHWFFLQHLSHFPATNFGRQ